MKVASVISLFAFCVSIVSTESNADPSPDQYCFQGCEVALAGQNFTGDPSTVDDDPAGSCENALYVQSMFVCARTYCTSHQARSGWEYAKNQCESSGYSFPSLSIVDNVTTEDVQTMQKLEYMDYMEAPLVINSTVIPSEDLFQLGYRTMSWWYDGLTNHLWYSKAIFIFWGVILGFGTCANLFFSIRNRLSARTGKDLESRSSNRSASAIGRMWDRIRAYLLLPALYGKSCSEPLWQATLPPRAESIVIAMHIALNVILCAVSYSAFPRNLYWEDYAFQIWRSFSDRTGYMSYANLVVFFAFGIRNNILIWFTGWEFPTFNRFHRWVARVATLEALLHSIGYTVYDLMNGLENYQADFASRYWWTGVIATICMCFILGFSILWLRVKFYDVFLILHIALSLMMLVCLFYHTEIFNGKYDGFLWPCVAFWTFDRLCRILRILYHIRSARVAGNMVDYDDEGGIVRIDATSVFLPKRSPGGVHYFLYSPFALLGWQSHPFTLVRWIESEQDDTGASSTSGQSLREKSPVAAATRHASRIPEGSPRYSFLVRPYKGYTARLRRLVTARSAATPMRFLYEGPYGKVPGVDRFTNISLLIGGSGISVGISSIYKALEGNPDATVNLTWACRKSPLYMDSIMNKELRSALDTGRLTVDVFITGGPWNIKEMSSRTVSQGRPDIYAAVREAVAGRRGSLAVVVCGPASFMDDARAAFVSELKHGGSDIELFMEAFNW